MVFAIVMTIFISIFVVRYILLKQADQYYLKGEYQKGKTVEGWARRADVAHQPPRGSVGRAAAASAPTRSFLNASAAPAGAPIPPRPGGVGLAGGGG